jgi:4'-phosphopantetheinyl transferase EntD
MNALDTLKKIATADAHADAPGLETRAYLAEHLFEVAQALGTTPEELRDAALAVPDATLAAQTLGTIQKAAGKAREAKTQARWTASQAVAKAVGVDGHPLRGEDRP